MIDESGVYDNFDDFLNEFHPDDTTARERIHREAERLAAHERGARLIELRERAQTSREQVAERMGVELQRVVDLEAGAIGFDLNRIDELTDTGPGEADQELHDIVHYIFDLSSYIRAIGGDVEVEISGATTEIIQENGSIITSMTPLHVPAPAEFFTPDMIYTLLMRKPEQMKIWAEVEGWRTNIAA
ncbi:helix-turn-helix domain-containing protein [Streptomyces lonegramiae]|uniref:Helix-turn-helix transcriptional regulator n=1 Tax=Streptomyces lonegramiae TaxID=3075524 RepID=A0ABU2XLW9_9ACTN|nr:helix-turn-helix transcriptional regulator [Streptomyces sp. DSM 41529]MDT0546918.1 helix-turn-helix transcriptional regulator [Streptomyces sp. DSM 41529]